MDKKVEREQKKKVRKMAASMLWADFKNLVLGWKVIALIFMLLVFFFLPYLGQLEDFNGAAIYYFALWAIMALAAFSETVFNYLPLSSKDIVYYLKYRTNVLLVCLTAVSVLMGTVMQVTGAEVFWERGLLLLIFMLVTIEWMLFEYLYEYSKPEGVKLRDNYFSTGRKVRIVIYNTYSILLLFSSLIGTMFMKAERNNWSLLLVFFCLYLVMFIFRADAVTWVQFNEFYKSPRRIMYAGMQQQNPQA